MNDHDNILLRMEDLHVDVGQPPHRVHALRGVSLTMKPGQRLGIIGESGSGKTMAALSILRLLPPTATTLRGAIWYRSQNLLALPEERLRAVRGKEIGVVFQNALTALNPLFPVGRQIADVYRFHEGVAADVAWDKAVATLDDMGIPDPQRRARAYPHQYSGGMAQRAMIAMALVCSPSLLIADEPTTGLDLTIQAQVLDLIHDHVVASGAALLLISHDLAVIADMCTDVVVMYAGEVLETGPLREIFAAPKSPYTKALIECFGVNVQDRRLAYIAGRVPDLRQEPVGCSFAARCPLADAICRRERPLLRQIGANHEVACHFA
ncbi:MAG: ABC transporter ATP-binding protein [Caldilineaceae bacterium]|nr:ABC transporter ATP-binding protein [Caldilineaceae bacterium]